MNLRLDETLLQNLTIQHLNVDIADGGSLQFRLRQDINQGSLKSLHLKTSRLLLEKTLDTHKDGMVDTQMLGHLLAILIIELTHKTLLDIRDTTTHLTFRKDHLALAIFHWLQDTLQDVELVVSHRTVLTRQLPGNITLGSNRP